MTWKTDLNEFIEQYPTVSAFAGNFKNEVQLDFLKKLSNAGVLPEDLENAVDNTEVLSRPMFQPGPYNVIDLVEELKDLLSKESSSAVFRESSVKTLVAAGGEHSERLKNLIAPVGTASGSLNAEPQEGGLNDDPAEPVLARDLTFSFIDGNDSFTITARTKENYVDQITAAIMGNRNAGRAVPAWSTGLSEESIRIFLGAKWEEGVRADTGTENIQHETTSKKTTFGGTAE